MPPDRETATDAPTTPNSPGPEVPRWLTPTGLPRAHALAAVQFGGLCLAVAGFVLMFQGGGVLGLVPVLYGFDVVVRPSARRLPRSGAVTDMLFGLVERWKGPPAP